jgi:hypothetical protein
VVGRYRTGVQQVTDTSTPEKSLGWLEFSCRQAEAVASLGCSQQTADQIRDYITWWTFAGLAARWFPSHPEFVSNAARRALSYSPALGPWQMRVRQAYPFLFVLCTIARRIRYHTGRAA